MCFQENNNKGRFQTGKYLLILAVFNMRPESNLDLTEFEMEKQVMLSIMMQFTQHSGVEKWLQCTWSWGRRVVTHPGVREVVMKYFLLLEG